MKNHSALSDRSPSPCQVEKIKFYSDSNDSEADLSAPDCRGRGGPACQAAPEVCPGEQGLQMRSPWPQPDRHGGGWQLPACPWCFWSWQCGAGCHLFCCPAPGCSEGPGMLLPRCICLQTQGSVQHRSSPALLGQTQPCLTAAAPAELPGGLSPASPVLNALQVRQMKS